MSAPWLRSLLWSARVAVKRWLARHTLVIEFCNECGRRQPVVWTADDALWVAAWGRSTSQSNDGGVLCPECFDRLARLQGLWLRWVPRVEAPGV